MEPKIIVINAFNWDASMVYTLSYENKLYDVYAEDEIDSFQVFMDYLGVEKLKSDLSLMAENEIPTYIHSFTYNVITPESSEEGDYSDHGYLIDGNNEYKVSMLNIVGDEAKKIGDENYMEGTLAEIANTCEKLGINSSEGSDWLSSVDPDRNYETGEETFYSVHIRDIDSEVLEALENFLNDRDSSFDMQLQVTKD